MLKFETDVRLNANANPAEISARLGDLVAAPYSFAKNERRKALRGRVSPQSGFLRWPLNESRTSSPRYLKFTFIDSEGGAVLVGKFVIWQPLRVAVLAWLACGLTFWTWTLINELIHHAGFSAVGKDLLIIAVGCCMAFGYLGGIVFLGRKRNGDLIRVLRIVLASEVGAEIVTALLTQNSNNGMSFVDLNRPKS
jgi:hypothetical protein